MPDVNKTMDFRYTVNCHQQISGEKCERIFSSHTVVASHCDLVTEKIGEIETCLMQQY